MRKAVALLGLSSVATAVAVGGCFFVANNPTGGPGGTGAGGPGGGPASLDGYICQGPATPPSGGSCVNVSTGTGVPGDAGGPSDGGTGMNVHHAWDGGHMSGSGSSTSTSSGAGGGSTTSTSSGTGTSTSTGTSGTSTSTSSSGSMSSASCNPVTNAGCSGSDVCGPDATGTTYTCQPQGSPANLAACDDCSDPASTCGAGGICIALDESGSVAICVEMCCTDADCGLGRCSTTGILPALPDGVGVCVAQ